MTRDFMYFGIAMLSVVLLGLFASLVRFSIEDWRHRHRRRFKVVTAMAIFVLGMGISAEYIAIRDLFFGVRQSNAYFWIVYGAGQIVSCAGGLWLIHVLREAWRSPFMQRWIWPGTAFAALAFATATLWF